MTDDKQRAVTFGKRRSTVRFRQAAPGCEALTSGNAGQGFIFIYAVLNRPPKTPQKRLDATRFGGGRPCKLWTARATVRAKFRCPGAARGRDARRWGPVWRRAAKDAGAVRGDDRPERRRTGVYRIVRGPSQHPDGRRTGATVELLHRPLDHVFRLPVRSPDSMCWWVRWLEATPEAVARCSWLAGRH